MIKVALFFIIFIIIIIIIIIILVLFQVCNLKGIPVTIRRIMKGFQ